MSRKTPRLPFGIFVAIITIAAVVIIFYSGENAIVSWDQPNTLQTRTNTLQRGNVTHSRFSTGPSDAIVTKIPVDGLSTNTAMSSSSTDITIFEPATNITYPLKALKLESARHAYERGFWQRAMPVPLHRWQAAANTTCIPHTSILPDWKRRVPYVIMIGAQKGGTTALSYYLYQHPSVQYFPGKELYYFDAELDQNPSILVNGSAINATKVLDYYQETIIGSMIPLLKFQYETLHALDSTPNYMWLSDRVPHRIFCATPWVKLLAVLRDPVDRAYSQYHMQVHHDLSNPDSRRGFVSFEDYISLDMKVLQDIGVLPKGYGGWHKSDSSQTDTSIGTDWLVSDQTKHAWAKYTKLGLNSPVGRGLYVLQLQQWFHVMDIYNKPRSDFKILSSQRLLEHPNETYAEVLSFLELRPHWLHKYSKIHTSTYKSTPMGPETRRKLQSFYRPFNQQLIGLLASSDWDGIWEYD